METGNWCVVEGSELILSLFMTSASSSGSFFFALSDVCVDVGCELNNSSRRAIAADNPMVTARMRSGRSTMLEVFLDRMYRC